MRLACGQSSVVSGRRGALRLESTEAHFGASCPPGIPEAPFRQRKGVDRTCSTVMVRCQGENPGGAYQGLPEKLLAWLTPSWYPYLY